MRKGVSKADLEKKKNADGEEDEEENGGEGGEDEETHRDKAKGQKYAKMKDSLPEYVLDLVEKQSLKATHPREYKSMCINKLFVKGKAGRLELNLTDQLFEEHKKIYTKRFSKEQDRAMPESIMTGLYFHNDRMAFKAALQAGDIEAVEGTDGKTFYSFTEFKRGKEDAAVETQQVGGSSKITKEQGKLLAKAFSAVGWSWNYKDKDAQKLMPGASIPASIMNLIKEAGESQNKLAKEAATLIKQWTGEKQDERFVKLKKGHCLCNQNIAKLNHMREFHELPDDLSPTKENLDKVMLEMAQHTNDYNELIETSKGFLKAKKKWDGTWWGYLWKVGQFLEPALRSFQLLGVHKLCHVWSFWKEYHKENTQLEET